MCSGTHPKDAPENLKIGLTFLHGTQYLFDILVDQYARHTWLKWGTLNFWLRKVITWFLRCECRSIAEHSMCMIWLIKIPQGKYSRMVLYVTESTSTCSIKSKHLYKRCCRCTLKISKYKKIIIMYESLGIWVSFLNHFVIFFNSNFWLLIIDCSSNWIYNYFFETP